MDDAATSSIPSSKIYNNLWNTKVPSKIKLFGWRVIHNSIAVRGALAKRCMKVDSNFSCFGETEESLIHALAQFHEAHIVWYVSPLRLDIPCSSSLSFCEWYYSLVTNFKEKTRWDLFWCILWGKWLKRNAFVFEKRKIEIVDVMLKAYGLVGEFAKANEKRGVVGNSDQIIQTWSPPRLGFYKVNADATCFNANVVGLRVVMRDSIRDVMAATCCTMKGEFKIVVAGALAARHALTIAMESGLLQILLEMDTSILCHKLKNNIRETSTLGSIVSDILYLGSLCSSIEFSHVGKQ
ncbi:uncharacterized protein LOC110695267 [Chenopodium quinoa]|nr:uncharacterized protein LOC110695267 [Chenopodium quinoa]